jgi:hypothetical protein
VSLSVPLSHDRDARWQRATVCMRDTGVNRRETVESKGVQIFEDAPGAGWVVQERLVRCRMFGKNEGIGFGLGAKGIGRRRASSVGSRIALFLKRRLLCVCVVLYEGAGGTMRRDALRLCRDG